MDQVMVSHDDLARMFVISALNSRDMVAGFQGLAAEELTVHLDTYQVLLATVERVKKQLGFPAETDAVEAAICLINQKIWESSSEVGRA